MLVCRYADGGRHGYGRLEHDHDGGRVVPVEYDPRAGTWVGRAGRARPAGEVALLPPAEPSKIISVALNHRAAGPGGAGGTSPADAPSPAVVLKPPSSLAGPGDVVGHPGAPWELRHEAELAVVIGTRCKRVPASAAAEVVAGYTCANDITAYARPGAGEAVRPGGNDPSGRPARCTPAGDAAGDGPARPAPPPVWAKHFDGLTPLGPWLATDLHPEDVEITCTVGGRTRQRGGTRDLLWPVGELIARISEHTTLLPGDVILTGTPAGSGPLSPGDRVEVSITGVGTLHNVIDTRPGVPWTPDTAAGGAPAGGAAAARAVSEKGSADDADNR